MSVDKQFLLDANVFIDAVRRRYYSFEICPGFWNSLLRQQKIKRVFSIDKVREELVAGKDELKRWIIDKAPKSFFLNTADIFIADEYRKIITWIQNENQYRPEAQSQFASGADGWLIAYAKAHNTTLVTLEVSDKNSKKKVKIPDVCAEFKVDYCDTFEMLKSLKQQFVLKKSK